MAKRPRTRLLPPRRCITCLQELPCTHFVEDTTSRDGISHNCKECEATGSVLHHEHPKVPDTVEVLVPPKTFTNHTTLYKPPAVLVRNDGTGYIPSLGAFT